MEEKGVNLLGLTACENKVACSAFAAPSIENGRHTKYCMHTPPHRASLPLSTLRLPKVELWRPDLPFFDHFMPESHETGHVLWWLSEKTHLTRGDTAVRDNIWNNDKRRHQCGHARCCMHFKHPFSFLTLSSSFHLYWTWHAPDSRRPWLALGEKALATIR